MKRVREYVVENEFVKAVRAAGGVAYKLTSQTANGLPDRLVLFFPAKTVFVELKAPGKQLRPLQRKRRYWDFRCYLARYAEGFLTELALCVLRGARRVDDRRVHDAPAVHHPAMLFEEFPARRKVPLAQSVVVDEFRAFALNRFFHDQQIQQIKCQTQQ